MPVYLRVLTPPQTTGDEATAKKAEKELATQLEKENQPSSAKKRKVSKTPSRKAQSTQARKGKKRQPLRKSQKDNTQPDFELGSPAPGLPPPAQAVLKEPKVCLYNEVEKGEAKGAIV